MCAENLLSGRTARAQVLQSRFLKIRLGRNHTSLRFSFFTSFFTSLIAFRHNDAEICFSNQRTSLSAERSATSS
jgi:hypothetical protein